MTHNDPEIDRIETVSRRRFIQLAAAGGISADNRLDRSETQDGRVRLTLEYPSEFIKKSPNIVFIQINVEEGGIFNAFTEPVFKNPVIETVVESATIKQVLIGNFQQEVSATNTTASGTGVKTPWEQGKQAVFGVAVVPDDAADNVDIRAQLRGRFNSRNINIVTNTAVDIIEQQTGPTNRDHLAGVAENRADLMEGLAQLLNAGAPSPPEAELAAAMRTVCWMSTDMLSKAVFGQLLGNVSTTAEYVWETVKLFASPFGLVDNTSNDTPDSSELDRHTPSFF